MLVGCAVTSRITSTFFFPKRPKWVERELDTQCFFCAHFHSLLHRSSQCDLALVCIWSFQLARPRDSSRHSRKNGKIKKRSWEVCQCVRPPNAPRFSIAILCVSFIITQQFLTYMSKRSRPLVAAQSKALRTFLRSPRCFCFAQLRSLTQAISSLALLLLRSRCCWMRRKKIVLLNFFSYFGLFLLVCSGTSRGGCGWILKVLKM